MGSLLGYVGEKSPLKRNVQASEVGNTALFLVSDLAPGSPAKRSTSTADTT